MSHNSLWAEMGTASTCHGSIGCLHPFSSECSMHACMSKPQPLQDFYEIRWRVGCFSSPRFTSWRCWSCCNNTFFFFTVFLHGFSFSFFLLIALDCVFRYHTHFHREFMSSDWSQCVILPLSLMNTSWANRTADCHLFLSVAFLFFFLMFALLCLSEHSASPTLGVTMALCRCWFC